MAEYRRLAAAVGEPDGMSGYLTAIHESENASVPPPLFQEYMQLAPEDLPDFPGYHAAAADSMAAPVVPVNSSGSGDDGEELMFDEADFGGVEEE